MAPGFRRSIALGYLAVRQRRWQGGKRRPSLLGAQANAPRQIQQSGKGAGLE
jgi:hypothetical protein